MQDLNHARYSHSSCELARHIYVFCGYDITDNRTNSVEKLAIDDADHTDGQASRRWELIPLGNLVYLPKLALQFSVPLNNREILILGVGYEDKKV